MFGAGPVGTIVGLTVWVAMLVGLFLTLRGMIRGWPETKRRRGELRMAAASARVETRRRSEMVRHAAAKAFPDRKALAAEVRMRAGGSLFVSPYNHAILAVNRETQEVILGTMAKPLFVPFGKILAAEIITDSNTITKTNRGSQAVGAAVGVLILGPVGLLAGSVTGSKRVQTKLSELSLRVTIEDWDNPVQTICFLNAGIKGADPRAKHIVALVQEVERIYANLNMAIKGRPEK